MKLLVLTKQQEGQLPYIHDTCQLPIPVASVAIPVVSPPSATLYLLKDTIPSIGMRILVLIDQLCRCQLWCIRRGRVAQILPRFEDSASGCAFWLTLCSHSLTNDRQVASAVPAQYFKKRRGVANGLVYAGGGIGGAVTSFVMNALLTKVGPSWAFRVLGLFILITGMPSACLVKERAPSQGHVFIEWCVPHKLISNFTHIPRNLFRDPKFVILFAAGGLATFPIIVPAFFLPLYATSLGLSAQVGTILVAAFNFSSGAGRILFGFMGDELGPLNSLLISLLLSGVSVLSIWRMSTSLTP